jgi:protein gp37
MTVSLNQLPTHKHGTAIEWCHVPGYKGETLNPIRARNKATGNVGHWCQKVSAGCTNCYAESLNLSKRFPWATHAPYTPAGFKEVEIFLDEDKLTQPLRWRGGRAIFWNDMTDGFGEWVPFEWIYQMLCVCAATPQHIHMHLTKRPERMAQINRDDFNAAMVQFELKHGPYPAMTQAWPLPNVWFGTSVENQQAADERIPHLLRCPAAVRFLSVEPMLGPVNFRWVDWHHRATCETYREYLERTGRVNEYESIREIGWIIYGAESGPGKTTNRCADEVNKWILDGVKQCHAASVPAFVKQIVIRRGENYKRVSGDPDAGWPHELKVRQWPHTLKRIDPELMSMARETVERGNMKFPKGQQSHGSDKATAANNAP